MNNEEFFEAQSQVGGTQKHPIQRLKLEDAISYLRLVKSKFGNDHYVYDRFIDILKEYQSGSIDLPQFVQSFSNLFRDHPDLIVRYNNYLPPKYRIDVQLNQQVQVSLPGTNLCGGATSVATSLTIHPGGSPTATIHSTHGSQCSHSSSPCSSTGNAVSNVCGSKDYGLESDFQALALKNKKPLESRDRGMKRQLMLNFLRQVKSRFGNDHYEYYDFLDILKEYHSRNIDLPEFNQSISSLFRDHPDLIVAFNSFDPPHSTHGSQGSHSPSPSASTGNAVNNEPIYKLQCPFKGHEFTRTINQDEEDQRKSVSDSIQQSIPSDNVESVTCHLETDMNVSGSFDN